MFPRRLHLKRDEKLTVEWDDGQTTVFPIAELRKACPCATCKELRKSMSSNRLTILPTNDAGGPVTVEKIERVGNYAIRPTWSDGHATGLYSFTYLRDLANGIPPSSEETWPKH